MPGERGGYYQPQTENHKMPSKPVNVKQVLVYLTHAQHARLQKLKERTGASMSESIRRAIDRYLKVAEGSR